MAINLADLTPNPVSKEGFFNETETSISNAITETGWYKLRQTHPTDQFIAVEAVTTAPDGSIMIDSDRYKYNVDENTSDWYLNFNV